LATASGFSAVQETDSDYDDLKQYVCCYKNYAADFGDSASCKKAPSKIQNWNAHTKNEITSKKWREIRFWRLPSPEQQLLAAASP